MPPSTEEIQRAHRSHSQRTQYLRCGKQYELARIDRVPEIPAAWTIGGKAFHTAIEIYEREYRGRPLDEIVAIFTDEYDTLTAQALAEFPIEEWQTSGRRKPENDLEIRRDLGQHWVRLYAAWADAEPWEIATLPDGSRGIEIEFDVDFQGVPVKGYIDQLVEYPDGTLVVRDLKTGSKRPNEASQLGLYKVALEQNYGLEVPYGDFYLARDAKVTEPIGLSTYTYELFSDWYVPLDTAIELGLFMPNPGDACRTCGVQYECPLFKGHE